MIQSSLRAIAVMAACAMPAFAQESTNVVATHGDWTVFSADNPRECWAVSPPKKTVNTRDGQVVDVRRGDIRLYIAYRPGAQGEVSFTGGYPFAPDSTVDINVGGTSFSLFTEGENAWAGSPADDARLIASLRGGVEAMVSGRSARGTKTVDTFSLSGVTAATDKAKEACR